MQAYVESDNRFAEFFERVSGLIQFQLPAHIEEGKSHLAVGFGCTGGQHRSVTMAEKMAVELANAGWPVSIRHRELERRVPTFSSSGFLHHGAQRQPAMAEQENARTPSIGRGEAR